MLVYYIKIIFLVVFRGGTLSFSYSKNLIQKFCFFKLTLLPKQSFTVFTRLLPCSMLKTQIQI